MPSTVTFDVVDAVNAEFDSAIEMEQALQTTLQRVAARAVLRLIEKSQTTQLGGQ